MEFNNDKNYMQSLEVSRSLEDYNDWSENRCKEIDIQIQQIAYFVDSLRMDLDQSLVNHKKFLATKEITIFFETRDLKKGEERVSDLKDSIFSVLADLKSDYVRKKLADSEYFSKNVDDCMKIVDLYKKLKNTTRFDENFLISTAKSFLKHNETDLMTTMLKMLPKERLQARCFDFVKLLAQQDKKMEAIGLILIAKFPHSKIPDMVDCINNDNFNSDNFKFASKKTSIEQCIKNIQNISDENSKNQCWRQLALYLAKEGDVRAVSVANKISVEHFKAVTLNGVAIELAKQGKGKAITAVQNLPNNVLISQDDLYKEVVRELAKTNLTKAVEAVSYVNDPKVKSQLIKELKDTYRCPAECFE